MSALRRDGSQSKSTQWPVAQILSNHFKLTVVRRGGECWHCLPSGLQGYLAHKEPPPPRNLQ